MGKLGEFDKRQINRMHLYIDEFQRGNMSLGVLYNNLEFLCLQLTEEIDQQTKATLMDCINELEIQNALEIEGIASAEESAIKVRSILKSVEELLSQIIAC